MPLLTILQNQHLMLSIMLLSVLSTILRVNGQDIIGKYVMGHANIKHVSNVHLVLLNTDDDDLLTFVLNR